MMLSVTFGLLVMGGPWMGFQVCISPESPKNERERDRERERERERERVSAC